MLWFCLFSMSASECYSESEHDDPEITDTPPPPYTVQPPPPPLVSVTAISLFLLGEQSKKCSRGGGPFRNNLNQRLEMLTLSACDVRVPDCPCPAAGRAVTAACTAGSLAPPKNSSFSRSHSTPYTRYGCSVQGF